MSRAGDHIQRPCRNARMSNWTLRQDSILVRILRSRYDEGEWVNGSFTKNAWRTILEMFNEEAGVVVTAQQINHRWKNLKQQFQIVSALRNKSGWGWDFDRQVPVAPDEEAWNQLDAEHRRFRDKRFPHYDDMEMMVGRDVARGLNATSSLFRDTPPMEEDYVDLGEDVPANQSQTPVGDTLSRGCKRSSTSGGSSSKRGRRSLDGETAAQLRDIMQQQLTFQQQQARREFEQEDLAKCTEVLRERAPMLGAMDYARVLMKLRDPNFRDVFKMAQVEDAVFRQFIQMALQD